MRKGEAVRVATGLEVGMKRAFFLVLFTLVLPLFLFSIANCDDDDDDDAASSDDDANNDDDDAPVDDDNDDDALDDDATPGDDDVLDDDTTTGDDDDDTMGDDDTVIGDEVFLQYLYGGVVAHGHSASNFHSGLNFNFAISSDGTLWAVGVKARQLMLFRYSEDQGVESEVLASFAGSPDMALGIDGLPRIVYIDLTDNSLVYIEPSQKGWTHTVISENILFDPAPHIAIDSNGFPNIVCHYLFLYDATMRFIYRNSNGWIEKNTGFREDKVDLVVTSQNQPIIIALNNAELHLFKFLEIDWDVEVVPVEGSSLFPPAAAIDADDKLHIVYGIGDKDCRYVTNRDGDWTIEEYNGGRYYSDLALDEEGRPHVTSTLYNGAIVHNWRDPVDGWQRENPVEDEDNTAITRIFITREGMINILRSRPNIAEFGFYKKTEDTWIYTNLYTGSLVKSTSVIRFDSLDRVHVLFGDNTKDKIFYATSDNHGNTWSVEDVVEGDFNSYMGMAVDHNGNPHIILFSNEDGSVLYGRRDESEWKFETIEEGLNEGVSYLRLELDNWDQPHIVYYDAFYNPDMGLLKYATLGDDGWNVETFGFAYWIYGMSLAVDLNGNAHIGIEEILNDFYLWSFHYASNALGYWFNVAIDQQSSCRGGDSIALASDAVHILTTHVQNDYQLRHLWFTDHQWNIEQTELYGVRPSLAIDGEDRLHAIVSGNNTLLYTWLGEDGWLQTPVDSFCEMDPGISSFAIGNNGFGYATYVLNSALWFVRFPLATE